MKFSLELSLDANQIHSYDNDTIVIRTIGNTDLLSVDEHLILTPNRIITDSPISDITQLTSRDISYLKALDPEVLILVQQTTVHFPVDIKAQFSELSIGVECMSLGAACRTYNLLIMEGRKAVLAVNFTQL